MCDSDRESHNRISQQIKSSSNLFSSVTHNEVNSQMSGSSSVSPALNFPPSNNCLMPTLPVSTPNVGPLSDYHRFQLYDYATQASMRFRLGHSPFAAGNYGMAVAAAAAAAAGYSHPVFNEGSSFSALSPFARFDPRFRFIHEEPKPQHSYIGLIAMAILSNQDHKMVLSDIYQHILDNYPYFRNRGPGWRNSIRHNLSLNDCFIKSGRSANGKGHYWAIHPANLDDFKKGDFRRRKAQRKVRKHMGLSVPDDDDSPSPTPPPVPPTNIPHQNASIFATNPLIGQANIHLPAHPICPRNLNLNPNSPIKLRNMRQFDSNELNNIGQFYNEKTVSRQSSSLCGNIRTNKRQFDMESLLAPDCDSTVDDNARFHTEAKSLSNCEHLKTRQSEENHPSVSPSGSSLNEYVISKTDSIGSNSSSPSVSSSAEKMMKQTSHPGMQAFISTSANNQQASPPNWQSVQLKSLQSLQQMGSGLIMNPALIPSGATSSKFASHIQMPWAMSAALTNAQAAATLLGYASSVAGQTFDLQNQPDKH